MTYDQITGETSVDNILAAPGGIFTSWGQPYMVNLMIALAFAALVLFILYYVFNARKPAARGGF